MTNDLNAVLARVAEKLHGGKRDGDLWRFEPRWLGYWAMSEVKLFDLLLTGNGMVETIELMLGRDYNFESECFGEMRWANFYKRHASLVHGRSGKTLAEAVIRAADAALKEST